MKVRLAIARHGRLLTAFYDSGSPCSTCSLSGSASSSFEDWDKPSGSSSGWLSMDGLSLSSGPRFCVDSCIRYYGDRTRLLCWSKVCPRSIILVTRRFFSMIAASAATIRTSVFCEADNSPIGGLRSPFMNTWNCSLCIFAEHRNDQATS